MALYWYENGNIVKNTWTASNTNSSSNKSSNPYQKQQSIQSPTPTKNITTAQELMRGPVKTLSPSSTIKEASDLIKLNRFRHVPIVDPKTSKLVGLISDRDLLKESASGSNTFIDWVNENNKGSKIISDVMTKKVLTAHIEERLEDIARAMLLERIGCMLILNDDEKLVGIITRSDILRLLMTRAPTHLWL